MAKIIVIGAGNVGKELALQLNTRGHIVLAHASRKLVRFHERNGKPILTGETGEIIRALMSVDDKADAIMLAIPNAEKGEIELEYMVHFRSLPIVTCAKAAHAYHYPEVRLLGEKIGNSATVGGGTDILATLKRRELQEADTTIYTVINGTLNYVWSAIQAGGSFSAAVSDAKALGYAEPSNDDPIAILDGEVLDACMKAAIVHNVALTFDDYLSPDDFTIVPIQSDDIRRLTSRNARFRFIVTFSSVPDHDEIDIGAPGSMRVRCGRWTITGGFHDVKAESPWFDWLRQIDGVNNGFMIHSAFGKDTGHSLGGPGAGPETTAAAMVRDLHRLLAR